MRKDARNEDRKQATETTEEEAIDAGAGPCLPAGVIELACARAHRGRRGELSVRSPPQKTPAVAHEEKEEPSDGCQFPAADAGEGDLGEDRHLKEEHFSGDENEHINEHMNDDMHGYMLSSLSISLCN